MSETEYAELDFPYEVNPEPGKVFDAFIVTVFVAPRKKGEEMLDLKKLQDSLIYQVMDEVALFQARILHGTRSEPSVAEITVDCGGWVSLDKMRYHPNIREIEKQYRVQLAIQPGSVYRRHKRLAVFDMDSTLIQQEVIDEIARKLGVEDKVSAITERAMNGELDFTESLRERCRLLKGIPSSVFIELRDVITLTPGAADLIKGLKRLGYKTAVLSGGFLPLTSWQAEQLGIDYAHANTLEINEEDKTLTGEVIGTIVNAEQKAELLKSIAAENGIPLSQVMAIGDGANDLPMMRAAGLGVAFNAKPKVQAEAPVRLNRKSLADVMYLLGVSAEERKELLE